jgi:hypothetical protein
VKTALKKSTPVEEDVRERGRLNIRVEKPKKDNRDHVSRVLPHFQ